MSSPEQHFQCMRGNIHKLKCLLVRRSTQCNIQLLSQRLYPKLRLESRNQTRLMPSLATKNFPPIDNLSSLRSLQFRLRIKNRVYLVLSNPPCTQQ
jgi:hypothetical protein